MLASNQFSGLLLWIYLLTFVQYVVCQGCTLQAFKDSRLYDEGFDLTGLKASFNSGDNVRVHCQVGFRGFFKLICSNGEWHKSGEKCRKVSCGHPGDVQFADFRLVKGTDYEFGSQVLYTCHSGYQMTSYTNTRNCLQQGWDGHLPVCEPIPCPPLTVSNGVLVNGDLDQSTSGSVLQFSCSSRDYTLIGPTRIDCDENGNWDNKPPICQEISCPKPQLHHFQVEGDKMLYKKDEVLRYSCDSGYKKVDGRPSLCKKVGQSAQWTPTPQCEVITCKLSPDPPAGTTYDPLNQIIFSPRQSVRVSCGETQWVKDRELQSAELTCQDTGHWDFDPVCQLVTCSKTAENVYSWQSTWYNTVDVHQYLWYQCHSGYEKTSSSAKCTRRGWEPNPLCKERGCTKLLHKNAEITDNYQKDKYQHNERVNFKCTYNPRVTFHVDCYYGDWIGSRPTCKEKPCTTQPHIESGEMLSVMKTVYDHGESLQFRCEGETTNSSVTCQSGEWKTDKSCHVHNTDHEKGVCGSTFIPNGFAHEHQNQLYYTCNEGYKLLIKGWWGVASCEEGAWKTSQCVAATDCGPVPDIPNLSVTSDRQRFSEGETFLISCEAGHQNLHRDLQELTCSGGEWTPNHVPFKPICTPIANKCSPPPKVENAVIMRSFEKEYPSGISLTYKCRKRFVMEGDSTIQCINGTWEQKSISCKGSFKHAD